MAISWNVFMFHIARKLTEVYHLTWIIMGWKIEFPLFRQDGWFYFLSWNAKFSLKYSPYILDPSMPVDIFLQACSHLSTQYMPHDSVWPSTYCHLSVIAILYFLQPQITCFPITLPKCLKQRCFYRLLTFEATSKYRNCIYQVCIQLAW